MFLHCIFLASTVRFPCMYVTTLYDLCNTSVFRKHCQIKYALITYWIISIHDCMYSWHVKYNQNFRKSAGTIIEISPLRNMIETSVFFHYTYCGELATPLLTVKPVGEYSTTFVQYLYISCYLSDNKPVLSYLSSRLLPQW